MFSIETLNTDGLGLHFKRGSLFSQLLKYPKPKERFFNNWSDEHGKDYDNVSPTVYETLQYNIDCYLIAESVADLQVKRSRILELISGPSGFTFFSNTLGRGFHLRYQDSPSFRNMVPLFTNGRIYCEFTLNLENNFEPTETWFRLADDEAYILTEDNEYIIIDEIRQNF
ncbi:hypothetical protein [Sphingobacterium cellulitidis]|uniref:hypothetical protein n=1 Tax=Sphingobacterium cellulitidis TaxID=1768011 RepID=UPI000B9459E4|nr:hypothetical protein CHT99_15535 [Sphingobacterium cellulitidis]